VEEGEFAVAPNQGWRRDRRWRSDIHAGPGRCGTNVGARCRAGCAPSLHPGRATSSGPASKARCAGSSGRLARGRRRNAPRLPTSDPRSWRPQWSRRRDGQVARMRQPVAKRRVVVSGGARTTRDTSWVRHLPVMGLTGRCDQKMVRWAVLGDVRLW
jgi:hypothetical protein